MPQQEIFFEERAGGLLVTVLKIYDQSYAKEVFNNLDEEAIQFLASSLEIEKSYDPADIPGPDEEDYEDFIWELLSEAAVEDVRQSPIVSSFFVVAERGAGKAEEIYISADWPSAEAFAKRRLAALTAGK